MSWLYILYGIVWKNVQGFLTKKHSGRWDWKKLVPDIGYGIVAGVLVYSFQVGFGISITEDAIMSSAVFMSLTHAVDKWWNALVKKFGWFGKRDKGFEFFT